MINRTSNNILLIVAFFVMILSCKNNTLEENTKAFSMSDTMLDKCKYHEVTLEDVKNEIRFFGKLEADNNKTAQVFSPLGGLVTSINVGLGDYVKQGDVLVTIQSSDVASFQKEKLNALNDVYVAEKNLQVAKDLFAGKLNSEKDVTVVEKELEKAQTELARINEVYRIYNIKSGSVFSIRAPISGFVVEKKININEMIRPDEDDPMFSLANTNEIWAVAYVNESDISQIKENYEVVINTLAFPNTPYKGKIDKIYNVIDPNTKSMKFRVQLGNADFKLKPDMNCTVRVHYSENKLMPVVPSSAVIFEKSKYWVMVFKDRHNVETRQVEVYRQMGDITYIKSGISEGETVISENGLLIYDALND